MGAFGSHAPALSEERIGVPLPGDRARDEAIGDERLLESRARQSLRVCRVLLARGIPGGGLVVLQRQLDCVAGFLVALDQVRLSPATELDELPPQAPTPSTAITVTPRPNSHGKADASQTHLVGMWLLSNGTFARVDGLERCGHPARFAHPEPQPRGQTFGLVGSVFGTELTVRGQALDRAFRS